MSGVVGAAAPPEPADQFQIFYDPAASQATFDMQSVPPRSFTAAGVDGTFALPGLVVGTLISSGDLTLTTSLAFTMNGGTTTVPITLTTGLAAAAGMVVEGMPIASDGRFALVGITPRAASDRRSAASSSRCGSPARRRRARTPISSTSRPGRRRCRPP